jgi:hypothetical protein
MLKEKKPYSAHAHFNKIILSKSFTRHHFLVDRRPKCTHELSNP